MEGYFIDIQGTLIDDKHFLPLPGSIEFLNALNKRGIPFVLVTNNTKKRSKEFFAYLKNLGFEFTNYIDPLIMLDTLNIDACKAYGNKHFLEIVGEKFILTSDSPQAVILGMKLYSNDEFAEIIEYCLQKEILLVSMHKTSIYAKNSKRYPGLGAIAEMIKYATSKEYMVLGKPSSEFFEKAREILGLNYDKITLISDDLKGDLIPAKKFGMRTVLVLSGKIKSKDEISENPDFVFENLEEYLRFLELQWKKN